MTLQTNSVKALNGTQNADANHEKITHQTSALLQPLTDSSENKRCILHVNSSLAASTRAMPAPDKQRNSKQLL